MLARAAKACLELTVTAAAAAAAAAALLLQVRQLTPMVVAGQRALGYAMVAEESLMAQLEYVSAPALPEHPLAPTGQLPLLEIRRTVTAARPAWEKAGMAGQKAGRPRRQAGWQAWQVGGRALKAAACCATRCAVPAVQADTATADAIAKGAQSKLDKLGFELACEDALARAICTSLAANASLKQASSPGLRRAVPRCAVLCCAPGLHKRRQPSTCIALERTGPVSAGLKSGLCSNKRQLGRRGP